MVGRNEELADFLVDRVRIDRVAATEYARRLVKDGFDDVQALHDDVREGDLGFFSKGHARRLLNELNKGSATSRQQRQHFSPSSASSQEYKEQANVEEVEEDIASVDDHPQERWRKASSSDSSSDTDSGACSPLSPLSPPLNEMMRDRVERGRRRVVAPVAHRLEEEHDIHMHKTTSPVAAARVRANSNSSQLGRVLRPSADTPVVATPNDNARSPTRGVTKRAHRRLRVHELIWQRRRKADTKVEEQVPVEKEKEQTAYLRPESAPVVGGWPQARQVVSSPKSRRSVSHQQKRRSSLVSGIVIGDLNEGNTTPHKDLDPFKEDPKSATSKHNTVDYDLSESGTLRMGEFKVGPNGLDDTGGSSGSGSAENTDQSPSLRSELIILDELGRGAGGSVQRSLHGPSGIIVAVKRMNIDDDGRRKQMILELRALHGLKGGSTAFAARIQHGLFREKSLTDVFGPKQGSSKPTVQPTNKEGQHHAGRRHIVDFLDTYVDKTTNTLCLVLEFMNGGSLDDLKRHSHAKGVMVDERILSRVAYCVSSALSFIHGRRELHRDMKPSNILLNMHGECKVSDYGCHRALDDDCSLARTFTGTLAFMSPERVAGEGYSYASDIWSLGLSLLATALGENPFSRGSTVYWDIAHAIQQQPAPTLDATKFSAEFRYFIHKCLQKSASARPAASDLLQYQFVRLGRRTTLGPLVQRALGPPDDEEQNHERDNTRLRSMLTSLHEHRRTVNKLQWLRRDEVEKRRLAKLTMKLKQNGIVEPAASESRATFFDDDDDISNELLTKISAQLGAAPETVSRVYSEVLKAAVPTTMPRRTDSAGSNSTLRTFAALDELGATIGKRRPDPPPALRPQRGPHPLITMQSYESHASSAALGASFCSHTSTLLSLASDLGAMAASGIVDHTECDTTTLGSPQEDDDEEDEEEQEHRAPLGDNLPISPVFHSPLKTPSSKQTDSPRHSHRRYNDLT